MTRHRHTGSRELLELSSGDAVARVDPAGGGRLISLQVAGAELLSGAAPGRLGPAGILSGCFPMVPFVGRLNRGEFTFDGKMWRVPRVLDGHAIHGLTYDRPWSVVGDCALSIRLDERWPFGGLARQTIELTPSSITIRLVVSNEERPMPAEAGFHPWFARSAFGREAQLSFAALRRYRCDASGIPIEATTDLGCRPWDDSFVGVPIPPSIRWDNALELNIDCPTDHWIVCETDRRAICIEPLTGPVNGLGLPDCRIVRPNAPLEIVMTLRWRLGGRTPGGATRWTGSSTMRSLRPNRT